MKDKRSERSVTHRVISEILIGTLKSVDIVSTSKPELLVKADHDGFSMFAVENATSCSLFSSLRLSPKSSLFRGIVASD